MGNLDNKENKENMEILENEENRENKTERTEKAEDTEKAERTKKAERIKNTEEQRKPLVEFSNISYFYQKQKPILQQISGSVSRGEIVGLSGENGSGKSTLLKIIAGFLTDYEGTLWIEENVRLHMACMIDTPSYFKEMSVLNNLKMMEIMNGPDIEPDTHLIERMGILEFSKTKASRLSLGNKQKLALCLAINKNTELALLDEPLNGLDPFGKAAFVEYLKERKKQGMAVLITSHIPGDLDLLCDRVIRL